MLSNYAGPDNPILLKATPSDDGVVLSVGDQGPGIPKEEQSLVFERFYRGAGVRDKTPGTGIGLAIARDIVRGHGSEIVLKSEPGHGSVFSFSLPAVKEGTR